MNNPTLEGLQAEIDRLSRENASLQPKPKPKGGPLKANRARGRQQTRCKDNHHGDPRAHQAWMYRGKDRRWRVVHRCQTTGHLQPPMVLGRGLRNKAKAEMMVRILQSRGLQTAAVIGGCMKPF